MTDSDEDIFIGIVLTYYGIVENKKTMPGMAESWMRQKKTTAWNDIHEHFVKATSVRVYLKSPTMRLQDLNNIFYLSWN